MFYFVKVYKGVFYGSERSEMAEFSQRLWFHRLISGGFVVTFFAILASHFANASSQRPEVFSYDTFFKDRVTHDDLKFSLEKTDLGEGRPGEEKVALLTVINNSGKTLYYFVQGGCSCSRINPKSGQLLPQSTSNINLYLKLEAEGVDKSASVRVDVSDVEIQGPSTSPLIASEVFTLSAKCPYLVKATSYSVNFGIVPLEKPAQEQVVRITNQFDAPFALDDIKVYCNNESISCEVKHEKDAHYVKLGLKEKPKTGVIRGSLFISVASLNNTLEIPIHGEVVNRVQFAPSVLRITGSQDTYSILLSSRENLFASAPAISCPGWLEVLDMKLHSGKRCTVRLKSKTNLPDSAGLEEDITVRCNTSDQPEVRIPVVYESSR